ncbi:MAG TPA: sugar transferase [Gemmatimonadaceae bacterium]|nr:sugar transferase [Gemmatimonadaceae bacterium]
MAKRALDVIVSAIGLVLLAPLLASVAVLIRIGSPGPIFFRQERVGQHGRRFRIHKFRTMYDARTEAGRSITVGADPRITQIGAFLRRYKLDELPQLIDVLRGDLSLVGPRPEVPAYVECYSDADRAVVLSVRPGITDRASIEFSNESELLATAKDPHSFYVNEVLPVKLRYYREYVASRSMLGDLRIIRDTFGKVFFARSRATGRGL